MLKHVAERIHPINLLVALIGLADLISTLYWLATNQMVEANPIMAALLSIGLPPFISVKIATLAAYVAVMEWYRRERCPKRAKAIGYVTTSAYLVIYFVSFCHVNAAFFLG